MTGSWLSGTTRRVLLGFGVLVGLFAVAAFSAGRGLSQVRDTLHRVSEEERRVRSVLELANVVRDQYAHEAHMLLLGNTSHLPMYETARKRLATLLADLEGSPLNEAEASTLQEIRLRSDEMDAIFRDEVVPALLAGDTKTMREAHDRTLALVLAVQAKADRLAVRFADDIAAFEKRTDELQRTAFWWVATLLLGAIAFAIGLGLYIGRSVARPVAALEAGAARLAAGDLETRIDIEREDEFGRLARQFNAMTGALARHQEELLQSERLASVGRLAAGVAHEINNPLGVILGYVRLLQQKTGEDCREELAVIEEETGRCKEIVDGLLDLARPWPMDDLEVDLRELCEQSLTRLRETTGLSGLDAEVEGSGEVAGNAGALQQLVVNLLKNAAEAAGPDGAVAVALSDSDSEVRLEVRDDGPGLSPEARRRLFEPFFTTKESGTGLGLAVSQAIVRAHGGSLEVDEAPGGGAIFRVTLPRTRTARGDEAAA